MGRVQHGLGDALEPLEPYLVQHQGQNDGDREAPEQTEEAQKYRVLHHAAKGGGAEEPLEPFQSHPFAAGEAPAGLVVPERDLDAVHGYVLIDESQYHGNGQHGVQLPVIPETFFQRPFHHHRRPCGSRLVLVHSSLLSVTRDSASGVPSQRALVPGVFYCLTVRAIRETLYLRYHHNSTLFIFSQYFVYVFLLFLSQFVFLHNL